MAYSRSNRRSRGRRRPGQKSGGVLRTVLLSSALVALPVLAMGGGGYLAYQHLNTETIDVAYCYQRHDQEQVAFFVDFSHTQNVSSSQQRDLKNRLASAYDALSPNGRISVFTTANDTTASVAKPVFSLCKPAQTTAEQERIGAPAISSTKLARQFRKARATFATFIDDLIAKSVHADTVARSSPILEQIQGISRYTFGAPLRKFILYTDGINNSATARFCSEPGHLPSFNRFAKRPDYRFIAPDDFGGAAIDLLLVESISLPNPSLPHCTHSELRAFYQSFFEANGAGSVRLTPLGYGAGQ